MLSSPRVPQPFPYQGSKRKLAQRILERLPRQFDRLIEPFAGSAAISLAAAQAKRANSFVIADVNRPLMDLWRAIVDAPLDLAARYELLWQAQLGRERDFYDEVREQFNREGKPEHFLYILARCVKAAIRYNAKGEFNNSPDNRRLGMKPATMRANLVACSGLLRGRCSILDLDYRGTLDLATDADVVYLDPPYQGVSGCRDARYSGQIAFDPFVAALSDLNKRKIPFVVSYDGRRDDRIYGQELPRELCLTRLEVEVGPSTQSTLLGRQETTYESLYLSRELERFVPMVRATPTQLQNALFDYS